MLNRPLALFAAVWTIGTAVGSQLAPGLLTWKAAALSAAMAVLLQMVPIPGKRYGTMLLVALAAAAYYQIYDAGNGSRIHFTESEPVELTASLGGTIRSPVRVDGDKVSFVLRADWIEAEGAGAQSGLGEDIQVSIRLLEQPEQREAAGWGRGDTAVITGTMKRPEPPRNFGAFDYRQYLYRKHIHWLVSVKETESVSVERRIGSGLFSVLQPVSVMRWNDDLRTYLGGVFDRSFRNGVDAGYMKSLVLGLRDDMDPDTFQQFSQLGLTHILAISGLHVAVFVGGCMWLLRMLRFTRENMLTVTMLLVPFYIAISGGSPSAVRAGIMAMVGLYIARRGLWKDTLNVIGLAAVVMLLWEPYYLFDVSFQLSFLVTLGLIIGVPRFSAFLPIRSDAIKSLLSVTTVAQFVSFPISVYYFHSFSLLSWAANLLLVPFISLIVLPLGTFVLGVGLVSSHAGGWLAWAAEKLNDLTFWLVAFGAERDPSRLIWPQPSLVWVALYYVALGAVYGGAVRWKESSRPAVSYGAVSAFIILLWFGYNPDLFDRTGKVQFIDVGQGDAILIRTPQGRNVLIDGGGTVSFRKPGEEWKERREPYEIGKKLLVPLLKQRGVQQIDLLIASHQDHDHIGGLTAVAQHIPIQAVLINGTWKGNDSSRELLDTAMRRGARIVTAASANRIRIDKYTELSVMTPSAPQAPIRLAEKQNGESTVVLLHMYQSRFLFTGDMEAAQEASLVQQLHDGAAAANRGGERAADNLGNGGDGGYSPVDVLKIAHHGSKTSTTQLWLDYWKPAYSVISVGLKNSYGHPNAQVVERIAGAGSTILRTDQDGEIVFTVYPKRLEVMKKR